MFNKIKHIRYRSVFCYNNTQTNSPVIFTRNIVRAHITRNGFLCYVEKSATHLSFIHIGYFRNNVPHVRTRFWYYKGNILRRFSCTIYRCISPLRVRPYIANGGIEVEMHMYHKSIQLTKVQPLLPVCAIRWDNKYIMDKLTIMCLYKVIERYIVVYTGSVKCIPGLNCMMKYIAQERMCLPVYSILFNTIAHVKLFFGLLYI